MRLDSTQDMDKNALQSKIRSRRTHQKSRLGCKNCKRRRVKCDEKKPSCTNCLQHSIDCDFGNAAGSNSATPSPPAGGGMSNPPFRFRQSKYQTLSCASPTSEPALTSPTTTTAPTAISTGVQCDLSVSYNSDSGGISLADLQLYHNYTTSTYKTLGHEPDDIHKVYQVHLPQWGFTFPSILHLILAISALHLASQHPEQREKYIRQADDHFTFGVRSVTSILAHLDSENCQRIYISAVLICLIYFGHGPPAGEYIVFSATGQAEWLVLMRGVRSILHSKHNEIFSGIMEPVPGPPVEEISPVLIGELRQHTRHIEEVRAFLERQVRDPDAREMYISVCTTLVESFDDTYKARSQGLDGICLMPAVIGWIYRLPEEFVGLLQEKDSFALMILAQWTMLLKYMGTSWLMVGWDRHVIGGIRMSLGQEFHQWIEWPWEVIHSDSMVA